MRKVRRRQAQYRLHMVVLLFCLIQWNPANRLERFESESVPYASSTVAFVDRSNFDFFIRKQGRMYTLINFRCFTHN